MFTVTSGLPYVGHQNTSVDTHVQEATWTVLKAYTSQLDMLCGRPSFIYSEALVVRVPYYTRVGGAALPTAGLIALQSQLSSALDLRVSLQWLRVSQPYLDASILASYLSAELQGQTFNRAVAMLQSVVSVLDRSSCQYIDLASSLVGLKVNLGGRLEAEPSKPRDTRQSATLGSLSPSLSTVNTSASYTASNGKGAYTVKVWLSNSSV
jgi:hypothetical protein